MDAQATNQAFGVGQLGLLYVALLAIAPIVNSLIVTAISGIKDLGRSARRTRVIDEARKETKFWAAWSKLLEACVPAGNEANRERVSAELQRIADALREQLRPQPEPTAFSQRENSLDTKDRCAGGDAYFCSMRRRRRTPAAPAASSSVC